MGRVFSGWFALSDVCVHFVVPVLLCGECVVAAVGPWGALALLPVVVVVWLVPESVGFWFVAPVLPTLSLAVAAEPLRASGFTVGSLLVSVVGEVRASGECVVAVVSRP